MPDWKPEIRRRLARLQLAPARENAIVEEVAQHLDESYAELLSSGMSEADAYRHVRAELHDGGLLTRGLQRVERSTNPEPIVLGTNRRTNMFADLWQDLRFGARMLLKHPGFTLIAVLTLALGIGANTAIFSLVQAVILRPLPFPEAGRLAQVWNANLEGDINHFAIKVRDYEEWRKHSQVFEQLAAYKVWTFTLTGSGEPEQIPGNWVTASFFSTLGVVPLLGRSFLPEEEQPGGPNVVILSYGLWQRRFGGDRNLLNQTIPLDGKAFTVVGIMPAGFEFPLQAAKRELWTPLIFQPAELQRGGNNLNVVGRLKPGFKLQQAQTELDALANRLESTQAPSNARFS